MSTVGNPLANNGIGSSYWGAFEGAGSNPLTILMVLPQRLGKSLQDATAKLSKKIQTFEQQKAAQLNNPDWKPGPGENLITEQEIQLDMSMIQQLQQFISQVQQMASNISKTKHEDRMTIARNMA